MCKTVGDISNHIHIHMHRVRTVKTCCLAWGNEKNCVESRPYMALLSKEMDRSKLSAYKALPEYQASPNNLLRHDILFRNYKTS